MPSVTPRNDLTITLERLEQGQIRLHEMMADLQKSMYELRRQSASKHESQTKSRPTKSRRKDSR